MVVRNQLQTAIKDAAERNDRRRLCTLRLIQTALRDRDQAHCVGHGEKISESDVAGLLATMIKQREEQLTADEAAGDTQSAEHTRKEIETIREFMPPLMDEGTMKTACAQVVREIGAAGLRDVGRTITALKKRYPGQMDLGRASGVVKGMLR
ncbi:MAG: GatB/YqeY domain-containing protein [Devosia sp.]